MTTSPIELRLPKRFQGKSLAGFVPKQQPDPREEGMKALRSGRGVFITGGTGTGKTHLAVALLAAYLPELPPTEKLNGILKSAEYAFIPSVEFFLELKRSFTADDGEEGVLKKYGSPEMLVFDDVGAEKVSDWSRQIFYTLIDRRYRYMRQTIITSNLSLGALSAAIDDRIASRIVEMCAVIELKGGDHRLSQ